MHNNFAFFVDFLCVLLVFNSRAYIFYIYILEMSETDATKTPKHKHLCNENTCTKYTSQKKEFLPFRAICLCLALDAYVCIKANECRFSLYGCNFFHSFCQFFFFFCKFMRFLSCNFCMHMCGVHSRLHWHRWCCFSLCLSLCECVFLVFLWLFSTKQPTVLSVHFFCSYNFFFAVAETFMSYYSQNLNCLHKNLNVFWFFSFQLAACSSCAIAVSIFYSFSIHSIHNYDWGFF